jgi:cytokinin riboside 5'-monophosphate phosphoribohydrolase
MNICVFCGSSEDLENEYYLFAEKCGESIGKSGHDLIYGAGKIGIMGRVASKTSLQGGKTIGVIPKRLNIDGVVSTDDNELIITEDMKSRKAVMQEMADAFLILPGGFGTLEEMLEVITLKQLQYHKKPIVILNFRNYFKPLIDMFEQMFLTNFANVSYKRLYYITSSIDEAIQYIETYQHEHIFDKYLKA